MVAGWLMGAGLYFYHFIPLVAAIALLVAGLVPLFFWQENSGESEVLSWFDDNLKILQEMPRHKAGVLIYFVLWLICARALWVLPGTAVAGLVTPWQLLPVTYIYWFAVATFVLGLLCFARLPAKAVLFLLCAHIFLLASYLPATHEYFYNADSWRHLAQELNFMDGNFFKTVTPAGTTGFWQRFDVGRLGYAQFWSFGVFAKAFFDLDLMDFNRWFGPAIWSLFFPILVFELGKTFDFKKSESLFIVWLSLLPFILQVAGATTLPVNIGFLFWLFLLLLIIKRRPDDYWAAAFLLVLGSLSIFGYTLYFILFWLAWFAFAILNLKFKIINTKSPIFNLFSSIFIFVIIVFSIPTLELATNYSQFNPNIDWLGQTRQIVGNFSAYFLATGPRPHDIASGNILFNQTPSYAFVPNVFTFKRFWFVGFAVLFWLAAFFGVIMLIRTGDIKGKFLALLFGGLLFGQIISRYFLSGENLLARRLDLILAFLAIMMVAAAISRHLIPGESWDLFVGRELRYVDRPEALRSVIFMVVAVVSVGIAASYSLGPDAKTVSRDEYQAMEYVWSQTKTDASHCVLADTYPLLALEAISAKQIIGGSFPFSENFDQPERLRLLKELKTRATSAVLADAKKITGARRCFAAVWAGEIKDGDRETVKKFGDIIVIND